MRSRIGRARIVVVAALASIGIVVASCSDDNGTGSANTQGNTSTSGNTATSGMASTTGTTGTTTTGTTGTVDAGPCGTGKNVAFSAVKSILTTAGCARADCHSAATTRGSLDLETDPYMALVNNNNQPADMCFVKKYVTACNVGQSFLVDALTMDPPFPGNCGGSDMQRMPQTPNPPLDAASIQTIEDWINSGAPM